MPSRRSKSTGPLKVTTEEFVLLFCASTGQQREDAAMQASISKIMGSNVWLDGVAFKIVDPELDLAVPAGDG